MGGDAMEWEDVHLDTPATTANERPWTVRQPSTMLDGGPRDLERVRVHERAHRVRVGGCGTPRRLRAGIHHGGSG